MVCHLLAHSPNALENQDSFKAQYLDFIPDLSHGHWGPKYLGYAIYISKAVRQQGAGSEAHLGKLGIL